MGEIAEGYLDGTFCMKCGEFLGEDAGYPLTCDVCAAQENLESKKEKTPSMNDERIPTSKKLADAMIEAGCPERLIRNAREYFYDDYKSSIATPCIQLVNDLAAFPELRERAMNGEFDAQPWESDEWAATDEAKEMFAEFPTVTVSLMKGEK